RAGREAHRPDSLEERLAILAVVPSPLHRLVQEGKHVRLPGVEAEQPCLQGWRAVPAVAGRREDDDSPQLRLAFGSSRIDRETRRSVPMKSRSSTQRSARRIRPSNGWRRPTKFAIRGSLS